MKESASCIIFDTEKTQVLLIKRRDISVWVLPGGGVEVGESPEEAALREGEEETGLKLKILRKVAIYSSTNRLTRPIHFYEAAIVSGTPQTGPETRAIRFFPIDALPRLFIPYYRSWILDALANVPQVLHKEISNLSYSSIFLYVLCHPIITIQFILTRMGIHLNLR